MIPSCLSPEGGRLNSQAQPRLAEGPWEPAGTREWDKASSRGTAPGSAPRFCSVMDGEEPIVLPSHLFMVLMFSTDPGDLPGVRHRQAGWDVLSKYLFMAAFRAREPSCPSVTKTN